MRDGADVGLEGDRLIIHDVVRLTGAPTMHCGEGGRGGVVDVDERDGTAGARGWQPASPGEVDQL